MIRNDDIQNNSFFNIVKNNFYFKLKYITLQKIYIFLKKTQRETKQIIYQLLHNKREKYIETECKHNKQIRSELGLVKFSYRL